MKSYTLNLNYNETDIQLFNVRIEWDGRETTCCFTLHLHDEMLARSASSNDYGCIKVETADQDVYCFKRYNEHLSVRLMTLELVFTNESAENIDNVIRRIKYATHLKIKDEAAKLKDKMDTFDDVFEKPYES